MPSARAQQALERFAENERLTADLLDDAATALLQWIEMQVTAADALPDDPAFNARIEEIRTAAQTAAQAGADESLTPDDVVARAQAALPTVNVPGTSPPAPAPAAYETHPSTVAQSASYPKSQSTAAQSTSYENEQARGASGYSYETKQPNAEYHAAGRRRSRRSTPRKG